MTERQDGLRKKVTNKTDISPEEFNELYKKTAALMFDLARNDKYVEINGHDDIDKMAAVAVVVVVEYLSDDTNDVQENWEKFNEHAGGFDIGLIYAKTFPDRARDTMDAIHEDMEEQFG